MVFFVIVVKVVVDVWGESGKYVIINICFFIDLFFIYFINRELREKVWCIYYNCGDNGDIFDNNDIIKCILILCDECVVLFGYDNYV